MASGTKTSSPTITASAARRLLLGGLGLLGDPARKVTPAVVRKQVESMGYVQVDTINIVARAHDHVLHSRLDGYEPRMLSTLLHRDRSLFEHWTHDASIVPTCWLRQWKARHARFHPRWMKSPWWAERMGGDPEGLMAHVKQRITDEGPLMSKDFQQEGKHGAWWGWRPQKAALEHLWRAGELAIVRRINFHKVYDLIERALPQIVDLPTMSDEDYTDWACSAALDRLGVATSGELAAFLCAVRPKDAAAWSAARVEDGTIAEVLVESVDGSAARKAFARPDWKRRAARRGAAPKRMRLLSPFDPIVRDRKRAMRLFNFDYRFEGFVPEAKRTYGYYVLPLLEGEALVGRLDAKLHRDRGVLEVKGQWWEPSVKVTTQRESRLDDALGRFAAFVGAETIERA